MGSDYDPLAVYVLSHIMCSKVAHANAELRKYIGWKHAPGDVVDSGCDVGECSSFSSVKVAS